MDKTITMVDVPNIELPQDVYDEAVEAGLDLSQLLYSAVCAELGTE